MFWQNDMISIKFHCTFILNILKMCMSAVDLVFIPSFDCAFNNGIIVLNMVHTSPFSSLDAFLTSNGEVFTF